MRGGNSATRGRFTRCTSRADARSDGDGRTEPLLAICARFLAGRRQGFVRTFMADARHGEGATPKSPSKQRRRRQRSRRAKPRSRKPRRRPRARRRLKLGAGISAEAATEKPADAAAPARVGIAVPAYSLDLHHADAAVFEAEPLHLLVERRAVDAELVGRRVAVPAVGFEHFANDLPLGAFERFLERLLADRCMLNTTPPCRGLPSAGRPA